MFQGNVVKKLEIHILCSITFLFLYLLLYEIKWKM